MEPNADGQKLPEGNQVGAFNQMVQQQQSMWMGNAILSNQSFLNSVVNPPMQFQQQMLPNKPYPEVDKAHVNIQMPKVPCAGVKQQSNQVASSTAKFAIANHNSMMRNNHHCLSIHHQFKIPLLSLCNLCKANLCNPLRLIK